MVIRQSAGQTVPFGSNYWMVVISACCTIMTSGIQRPYAPLLSDMAEKSILGFGKHSSPVGVQHGSLQQSQFRISASGDSFDPESRPGIM